MGLILSVLHLDSAVSSPNWCARASLKILRRLLTAYIGHHSYEWTNAGRFVQAKWHCLVVPSFACECLWHRMRVLMKRQLQLFLKGSPCEFVTGVC